MTLLNNFTFSFKINLVEEATSLFRLNLLTQLEDKESNLFTKLLSFYPLVLVSLRFKTLQTESTGDDPDRTPSNILKNYSVTSKSSLKSTPPVPLYERMCLHLLNHFDIVHVKPSYPRYPPNTMPSSSWSDPKSVQTQI